MGGSSKKVTVGYKYYAGEHMVLCHGPIDKVSEIYVDNRLAWEGESEGGQIEVDAAGLFGGQSREGGVSGLVDIEMGAPDQNKNSYLQSILGDAIPAFRGVVSAVLRQCYLGNNPYLKPWSFRAQRIHVTGRNGDEQWYDEKAGIDRRVIEIEPVLSWRGTEPEAPAITGLDYASGVSLPTVEKFFFGDASGRVWTLYGRDHAAGGFTGTFLQLAEYQAHGLFSYNKMFIEADDAFGFEGDFTLKLSHSDAGYVSSVGQVIMVGCFRDYSPSTMRPGEWVLSRGTTGWSFTISTDSAESAKYVSTLGVVPESTVEYEVEVRRRAGVLYIYIDGVLRGSQNINFGNVPLYKDSRIGIGGRPHLATSLPNNFCTGVFRNFSFRGADYIDQDMNPAHIIRETITDGVWGMGYVPADIDDEYFVAAADALFEEGMGISLLWDRSSDIEAFQEEILRHINGVLRMDHVTGKFQLKLIRDDYEVGELLVLNGSNVSKVEDYQRPSFSELINTVVVNYWDSELNESASISVDDPALVLQQGFGNSSTMDYPGFTSKEVASRAGLRDLAALSSPLITCTILCDRSAATLNIGDPFVLDLPDEGINNVVMRVVKGSFGDGKSHGIRLEVAQDVFTSPASGVVTDGDESWESPDVEPEPADYRVLVEAPYYELVQRYGQTATDALLDDNPEVGYLQVSAARPSSAYNAQFVVDSGAGYNVDDSIAMDFCPTATLVASVGYLDSAWSIENGIDLDQVSVGTHAQINNELFRVDAIDIGAGTLTVGRGVLDTVPAPHGSGDRIYFWDAYAESDEIEYADAETIDVKVLPAAGKGMLTIADAAADSIAFNSRAIRPYPPGNIKINDEYFPSVLTDTIVVTWSHRDRLQQTSGQLFEFTAGDIGPESGTTYNGYVYDVDTDVLLVSDTDIGSGWEPSVAGTYQLRLEIESERDGFVSYQRQSILLDFVGTGRLTEVADARVTEGGDLRELESI